MHVAGSDVSCVVTRAVSAARGFTYAVDLPANATQLDHHAAGTTTDFELSFQTVRTEGTRLAQGHRMPAPRRTAPPSAAAETPPGCGGLPSRVTDIA
jgi:hypothetical protein